MILTRFYRHMERVLNGIETIYWARIIVNIVKVIFQTALGTCTPNAVCFLRVLFVIFVDPSVNTNWMYTKFS
jgi:uncharacterized membrane protein